MFLIGSIRNFYARFERPISSMSLVAGFVFDIVTLKRVDTLWENLWIFGHLLIIGIFIILTHVHDGKVGDEEDPTKKHFWYVNILQFFFGGILSTYLVFYFRSSDIFVTWPFIAILILAFIANESLKRHYTRLSFQISLFFLSIYSFAIFLVPVVVHQIGNWVFILSGIISLFTILFFTAILFTFTKDRFLKSKRFILILILSIFVGVNVLYFTKLIPPIPLSLKDAGVYHTLHKTEGGDYLATHEYHGWRGYFKLYEDFTKISSGPVYAYSAIFSPKGLNLNIIHEWQYYDEGRNVWVTDKIINLPVIGGRDGGFRTYSVRSNLPLGKWRVNIKTEHNRTIGHLRFNIIPPNVDPVLELEIKK